MVASRTPPVRLGGVFITNPSKPFWPDDGLTKLDLARFYSRVASHILPWMKGRALTMERCPDGIRRKCFYQKQAPDNLPEEVSTVKIPAPTAGRDGGWFCFGGARRRPAADAPRGSRARGVCEDLGRTRAARVRAAAPRRDTGSGARVRRGNRR
jgi:hypothetical protein